MITCKNQIKNMLNDKLLNYKTFKLRINKEITIIRIKFVKALVDIRTNTYAPLYLCGLMVSDIDH